MKNKRPDLRERKKQIKQMQDESGKISMLDYKAKDIPVFDPELGMVEALAFIAALKARKANQWF